MGKMEKDDTRERERKKKKQILDRQMSNENWRERAREKDTAGDRKTEKWGREKIERDK